MDLNDIKVLLENAKNELDKAMKIIDANNKNTSKNDIKQCVAYVKNCVDNTEKITAWLNNALQ